MDDEDDDQKTEAQKQIDQQQRNSGQPVDPSQQHRPEADR
jgi:hypothetical protein